MLESLEIRIAEPIENYKYEWISAVAHYAVDPDAPANARIADLGLAPRDHDGKVRFSGDVVLLRPADGANGRAILSVPNRGMVRLPYSGSGIGPTGVRTPPSPGDGFLLDRGWTIALPGWQWDVPRDTGFVGLDAPVADVEPGWLRSDFRVDAPSQERPVGDMMPSLGGAMPAFAFTSYPASRLDDPEAALRVRSAHMGPSRLIPRSQWRFTSATSIALDGGFQPFHWYELIYRSSFAPVAGAGLLALRDFGSHLRGDHDFVFASGVSQTGRVLREFLFEGLNVDEQGDQVFDGVLAEIASARRGEFNRRYAQPGLLHPLMPEYGPSARHGFPARAAARARRGAEDRPDQQLVGVLARRRRARAPGSGHRRRPARGPGRAQLPDQRHRSHRPGGRGEADVPGRQPAAQPRPVPGRARPVRAARASGSSTGSSPRRARCRGRPTEPP